jgi:hypothetical protein
VSARQERINANHQTSLLRACMVPYGPDHRQKQFFRFFVGAAYGLTPQHHSVTGRRIWVIERSDGLHQINVFSPSDQASHCSHP